ncbi:hypothetical protein ABIB89_003205 [Bradyrhizobium sp. JR3.12]
MPTELENAVHRYFRSIAVHHNGERVTNGNGSAWITVGAKKAVL